MRTRCSAVVSLLEPGVPRWLLGCQGAGSCLVVGRFGLPQSSDVRPAGNLERMLFISLSSLPTPCRCDALASTQGCQVPVALHTDLASVVLVAGGHLG